MKNNISIFSLLVMCSIFCVACVPIAWRVGPESIPDLFSEKYYYKTYTIDKNIEQLQMNLTAYSLRCDYGINTTWRTFQKSSPTEAILVAENGMIFMFGARAKEEGEQTKIDLYTWADKEFPEYFMIALENGQCVNPSAITGISGNPVIMERMNKAQP